ncbi:MAG: FkbM family methyltransferase [Acidimicrobiia bacterium]
MIWITDAVRRGVSVVRDTPLEAPARFARSLWWDLSGRVPQHERYDRQTVAILERAVSSDSNCIDVGAHRGAILQTIQRVAPYGRHLAIEPLPHLATDLQARFPDVDVRSCALSDVTGRVTFTHVVSAPAYSGLQSRVDLPAWSEIEQLEVPLERLDDLVDPETPIAFVKIDVEGAELSVLRGAVSTLQRWRPVVVFEHGLGGADAYGALPEDVFDFLAACGLQVSRLNDWLQGRSHLSRRAFCEEFYERREYVFVADANSSRM